MDILWTNPQSTITLAPTGNDNMPWQDTGTIILSTLAGAVSISGVVAPVEDRPPLFILNASGQNVTLSDSSTSSAAGNRITTGTGAAVTLASGGAATLIYDFTLAGWRIAGKY